MNALDWCLHLGFSLVPQQIQGERKGLVKFKEVDRRTESELKSIWPSVACNVAAKAGESSGGLVEIDIDARECPAELRAFLPATDWVWGRPGNQNSHWAYITDSEPQLELKDPLAEHGQKPTIVEIRGGRNKLITLPPAKHGSSGETVNFTGDVPTDLPPRIDSAELVRTAKLMAAACLLHRYAPGDGAHDYIFAWGGASRTSGLSDSEAELVARAILAKFDTGRLEDHIHTMHDGRRTDQSKRLVGWTKLADQWTLNRAQRARLLKTVRSWLDDQKTGEGLVAPKCLVSPEGRFYLGPADTETYPHTCTPHNLQSTLVHLYAGAFDALGDFSLSKIRQAATPIAALKYSYVVPDTTFEATTRTLTVGVSPDPSLIPGYSADVQNWLFVLAGTKSAGRKLCEWLAATRPDRLLSACPALCLIGEPGAGKSVLAHALARCWGRSEALRGNLLVARFNGELQACPILLCDESLPKGLTGTMFRTAISTTVQEIERKGLERTKIDGCLRIVLAANSDEILDLGPREKADADAIGQRLIRIDIGADRVQACVRAADPLRESANPERLDLAKIARHLMWMWENVPLTSRSDRWIVEPAEDSTQTVLEGHAVAHEELWEYVEAEVRRMTEPGVGLNTHAVGLPNGGVYLRPEGLVVVPVELAEHLSSRYALEMRDALRPFVQNKRHHWKLEGRTVNGWLLANDRLPKCVKTFIPRELQNV